jgi:hypothetical protein
MARDFLFFVTSRPDLGPTKRPIVCMLPSFYPGVKRSGPETDHSGASSVEVKN